MSNFEQYIYLGYLKPIYYYIHTQYNKKLTTDKINNELSPQIFNAMINETMIKKDNFVVIYNIFKNNKIDVVITRHKESKDKINDISKNELVKVFKIMIRAKRNKILVFRHYINRIDTIEGEWKNKSFEKIFGDTNIKIRDILYFLTKKPINY